MRKYLCSLPLLSAALLFPAPALAHCPLCVAGAAAGLTLSRVLGIDDSVTGIWIAAFLGAVSFWTEGFIAKKIKFSFLKEVVYLTIFVLTLVSFYQFNLVNKMGDIFGIHKLTFGIIAGGISFYLVDLIDDYLIRKNGKVFFPYQRIVVSLGSIIALSVLDFLLINYVL